MNEYFSRLNPAERRFVIGVALVFFLVINIFWVRPHFSDWSNLNHRLDAANTTLARYNQAVAEKPKLEAELKKLASEGSSVPPEDQSIQFLRTIQTQAYQSGVNFQGSSRSFSSTNQFFLEQAQTISVIAREEQLVNFLYNLGSGNSLIRVREISIRPDPSRQQLNANITLVASYQKTSKSPAAAKAAAPTARPAAPAAKPAPKPSPVPLPKPASKLAAPKAAMPNRK